MTDVPPERIADIGTAVKELTLPDDKPTFLKGDAVVLFFVSNRANGADLFRWLHGEVRVKLSYRCTLGQDIFNWLEREDQTINLILLPLDFARADELLKQIHAHPRLAATRVVATDLAVTPVGIQRAQDAGFDGLIPVEQRALEHLFAWFSVREAPFWSYIAGA
jgi:hypothetical protein